MKASEILCHQPVRVKPTDGVDLVLEEMKQSHFHHLPVMVGEVLVGVISDQDMLQGACALGQSRTSVRPPAAQCVREFMSPPGKSIHGDVGISEVTELLLTQRIPALPVMDDKKLLGLLTKRHLLSWFREFCENNAGHAAAVCPVRHHMCHDVWTVHPDDPLHTAVAKMAMAEVKHLPVVQDKKLVGIISARDVHAAIGEESPQASRVGNGNGDGAASIPLRVVMTPHPRTVDADATMADAVMLMLDHDVHALPVVSGELMVGIITDTDLGRVVRSLVMAPAC